MRNIPIFLIEDFNFVHMALMPDIPIFITIQNISCQITRDVMFKVNALQSLIR
jgi:hypothetical protein